MSCHFWWYVEHHITPHGLRVMALRSCMSLTCHLEAPKGRSSQSGLRDFRRYIIKWIDECTIIQSEYKINYFNNKFNGEIRSGLTLK